MCRIHGASRVSNHVSGIARPRCITLHGLPGHRTRDKRKSHLVSQWFLIGLGRSVSLYQWKQLVNVCHN